MKKIGYETLKKIKYEKLRPINYNIGVTLVDENNMSGWKLLNANLFLNRKNEVF